MGIKERKQDGITVVDISGNVRIGQEDVKLRKLFRSLLTRGDLQFVFDLTGVGFIDSAGVAEIVACFKRARESGGAVKMALQPRGKPEEVFQITSLDRVFEIYHRVDEAIASFG